MTAPTPVTMSEDGTLTLMVPVKVSAKFLADIVLTGIEAGHSGIYYWSPKQRLRIPAEGFQKPANQDKVVTEQKEGEHWDEYIGRNVVEGGTLGFVEDCGEGDKPVWQTLTREGLIRGFTEWLTKYPHLARPEPQDDGTMAYDIDAESADIILQLALLGEVRYG